MIDDRRRFRKIYTRLWRNPVFRALPDADKVMTLYLLSGPQTNRIGLFYVSIVTAAEDLDSTPELVRDRLRRVCEAFDWLFDAIANVLWIPSWWDFNSPSENLKNMQGALSDLHELPTTPLIGQFANHLAFVPEGLHPLFRFIQQKHDQRTVKGHRSDTDRTTRQDQTREEIRPDQTESSAALTRTEPAVLTFPTVGMGGTSWVLTEPQVIAWQSSYPGLDVLAEARKALAWVEANPGRRKTTRGMAAFLVNWFNRSTDRGGSQQRSASPDGLSRITGSAMRAVREAQE